MQSLPWNCGKNGTIEVSAIVGCPSKCADPGSSTLPPTTRGVKGWRQKSVRGGETSIGGPPDLEKPSTTRQRWNAELRYSCSLTIATLKSSQQLHDLSALPPLLPGALDATSATRSPARARGPATLRLFRATHPQTRPRPCGRGRERHPQGGGTNGTARRRGDACRRSAATAAAAPNITFAAAPAEARACVHTPAHTRAHHRCCRCRRHCRECEPKHEQSNVEDACI